MRRKRVVTLLKRMVMEGCLICTAAMLTVGTAAPGHAQDEANKDSAKESQSAKETKNRKKTPEGKPENEGQSNAQKKSQEAEPCPGAGPDAKADDYSDCRGTFDASFYIGLAIDTFAGSDTLQYLNPGDSGKTHERAVGGFDFAYRLMGKPAPIKPVLKKTDSDGGSGEGASENATLPKGSPKEKEKNKKEEEESGFKPSLWVYGETIHGVRSVDVNCTQNKDLPVCQKSLVQPTNPGDQLYFILRNASSLEGYMGLRYEFMGLQRRSDSPANLYVKAQAGFLDVAGAPGSALDLHQIALGAIATKGTFQDSYLEVGWGRSDTFATARRRRVKIDGYLEREIGKGISFFTQLFVDTDLGRGSDAIQTYIGFSFDLGHLFESKASSKTDKVKPSTEPSTNQ